MGNHIHIMLKEGKEDLTLVFKRILRFDQESGNSIVLVNYGLHADTVNGELISSDWPGWMRRTLDKALDGVKCIFFNGAEGDVGSTHVFPSGGDMNDTEIQGYGRLVCHIALLLGQWQ